MRNINPFLQPMSTNRERISFQEKKNCLEIEENSFVFLESKVFRFKFSVFSVECHRAGDY